jgi:Na+-translocating ferredoxin:NAD+ oxidoreductase RnfC subunit
MTPTKRHREYVGTCLTCDIPEVITKRRYYMVWASDFYGVAGTCEEVCEYYFPSIRVFKQWVASKTAQREKEAKEYYERERQIQAEYEARMARQREEAALLKEAERVAYRAAHAVELEAGQVARAFWPEEEKQEKVSFNDGLGDLDLDDHPF